MKILVISHLWPGNPQSTNPLSGIYVKEQIDALRVHEDVDVAVPVMLLPNLGEILKKKVCPFVRLFWREDRIMPVKYIPMISKHINGIIIGIIMSFKLKRNIDIIHAHTVFPDGIAAAMLSAMTGKPFVVTIHGSEIMFIKKRPLDRMIARYILNRSSYIISVSERMKQILRHIGVNVPIEIIRNGISESFEKSSGNAILFVGKLIDVKDPVMLIEAFRLFSMKNEGTELIIAGDGHLRKKIEHLVNEYNLSGRVRLLGFVERDRINEVYEQGSALVISSRSEGFPTILFEAMSAGMPVVSFDIGGIAEIVNSKNGIIVKERSAEALSMAMHESINKEWDRDAIRAAASRYTWNNIAVNITDIYMRIKKGAPRAPHKISE